MIAATHSTGQNNNLERLLHGWNTFNSVIFELFATFSDAYINFRFSMHVITAIK